MEQWAGVVLAAGQGVRMNSKRPKVLHTLCGKELIRYPVDLLRQLEVQSVTVVVSPGNGDAIRQALGDSVDYVTQPSVLGTGDAVARAVEQLRDRAAHVFVQGGDSPLLRPESARKLMDHHLSGQHDLTLLTATGVVTQDLGRVLRDEQDQVIDIVESSDWQQDASLPSEVNGGFYCFSVPWLRDNLERVEPSARGEKYLTALVAIGSARGARIKGVVGDDPEEMLGINNRVQLAQLEAIQQQRLREHWMLAGVTIQDPASVFIDAGVTIGRDTVLRPNTILRGSTAIGEDCEIGPNSVICDSRVGDRCRVTASALEEATVEQDVEIGPFCHLRPGAYLEQGVHLGNYVEVKNSRLGAGTASGHFSYLGDATIGDRVNIGAGTITCNYDGQDKQPTVIESGAFIGCDTMLVAPVRVGAAAITGAGSVVTRDVPQGRLAVGVPARIVEPKSKKDG